tara:strand:- start:2881 stop:3801 length:921 start_codon:yes stop_codon:yes gene_type:complete
MKIVKKSDPLGVDNLVVLMYGEPGVGKTSLGFSTKKSLLLDFDHGSHRSAFRGDSVQVESWGEISGLTRADLKGYDTVVVDTVGRQLDYITRGMAENDPRVLNRNGGLTMPGWGALKSTFSGWINRLQTFGLNVVLTAHVKEEKSGDEILKRPDIQGGSYAEVMKCADMVGYLYRGPTGAILDFNPTDRWIGKNAPELAPLEIPSLHNAPDCLGQVIANSIEILNKRNHASQVVADEVSDWRGKVDEAGNKDQVNALKEKCIEEIEDKVILKQVKGLIVDRAKSLGLVYAGTPAKGQFEEAPHASA